MMRDTSPLVFPVIRVMAESDDEGLMACVVGDIAKTIRDVA